MSVTADPTFRLETERLVIRRVTFDDAAFIVELLNEPLFIKNIADRGVRDIEGAKKYLEAGPMAMYAKHGFGLFHVGRKSDGASVGICGLLKRDYLEDVDVGFAMLARHAGSGYATEAATAVMNYGREKLGLQRIVAITAPNNESSAKVLRKLGLKFDRILQLPGFSGDSWLYVPEVLSS